MPSASEERKVGQLPEHMIRDFFEDGYLVVKDFFKEEELEPCKDEINKQVDEFAQKLYQDGKIKNLYKEYGFYERLTKIEEEFKGANIILLKYPRMEAAFKALWTNERLLNVMEQLLGPEVAGHPLWNLRTKIPNDRKTTVPWHQDAAYMSDDSYSVTQITAWIPMIDATEQNGCMQVVRGGHKTGKIAEHKCIDDDTTYLVLYGEEMEQNLGVDLKKDVVTCEVPYGGMLLFLNTTPHRSLPNRSNQIRWSFDLRWQKPDAPYGFYDMKPGVLMRTEKDPNHKISWAEFDKTGRHALLLKAMDNHPESFIGEDEYSLNITGPWKQKWELIKVDENYKRL